MEYHKFQKVSCSKRISGVSDEFSFTQQIVKGSSPLIVLKLTKHSSLKKVVKICLIYTKNKSNKHYKISPLVGIKDKRLIGC